MTLYIPGSSYLFCKLIERDYQSLGARSQNDRVKEGRVFWAQFAICHGYFMHTVSTYIEVVL